MSEYLRIKVFAVLEAAKDNEDQAVINACRRLIVADRKGWRPCRDLRDVELVHDLFEACRE